MNLIEQLTHWYNCRKIELSAWLKDSSKRYFASFDEKTEKYSMVSVSAITTPGTPEWDKQQTVMKAAQERNDKLRAMDPLFAARQDKKRAAFKAEADDSWKRSGLSPEQIARAKEKLANLK